MKRQFLLFILLGVARFLFSSYPLQLKTNNLAIYASEPLSQPLTEMLGKLDDNIDAFQMELGVYLDALAPVYLIESDRSYQTLALGKAKIVEFSDAFYSGKEKRIYVKPLASIQENHRKILLHEYIHWYLEQIFTQTPLWFHEGMATHFSQQMGFEQYLFFLQESFLGKKSDLFRLSYNYPEKKEDWALFYLSSTMAVSYLKEKKNEQWNNFWESVAQQQRKNQQTPFTEYFNRAFQTTFYNFHKEYAGYIKHLRYQYLFWSINALLALLLPVILIIAWRIRKKRLSALPDLPLPEDDETEI
ncbi:MAG TPA: hypothetical protein PLJ90_05105 [Candidatus Cloacimonas sp.]|nr:hypothetical protein [Candidatus Cloacimonas sp.]HNS84257.1 hypothetical protein [Candidatus Cloacimonas sp.]HQM04068.1 hypothetical protein [Candidatus Cloacimonas sp.]